MPYNWENFQQQQLAGVPNASGMPQQNNAMATLQNAPQQQLRTGKNPNPKFPRLRDWWEGIKTGGKEFAFGTPDQIQQVQNYSPQQQGIMQLLQELGVYGLQNPYEGFEDISQQAHNQFSQDVIPGLAERFASLGNNALSSPAFQNRLGSASAQLQSDLASQKAQYGQQNVQQILQMLQMGLQPQFENVHRPKSNGLVQNAILGGINAAPGLYQGRQISKAIDVLTKGAQG